MVKVSDGPIHPSKLGVTVIVAVIGVVPVLTAIELMLHTPEVQKPISKSDDQS